jgi:hypothetical protein
LFRLLTAQFFSPLMQGSALWVEKGLVWSGGAGEI